VRANQRVGGVHLDHRQPARAYCRDVTALNQSVHPPPS
jgi:hypothetical protein